MAHPRWGVVTEGFQERMLHGSLKDKQVFFRDERGTESWREAAPGEAGAQDSFRKQPRTLDVKPRD